MQRKKKKNELLKKTYNGESLEYVAFADGNKDKALKNPIHFFKIFNCVRESVTPSQVIWEHGGQNNGEKLIKNCTPTT